MWNPLFLLLALLLFSLNSAFAAEDGDVTIVTVTGEIQAEPTCEINDGEDKVVSFGNVRPGSIDSGEYIQPVSINFVCDSESITADQTMTFSINGVHADFDDGSGTLLKVSGIDGLGVKIFHNGNVLPLGESVNLNVTSDVIGLSALLVKRRNEEIKVGDFYAAAVIQINIQ